MVGAGGPLSCIVVLLQPIDTHSEYNFGRHHGKDGGRAPISITFASFTVAAFALDSIEWNERQKIVKNTVLLIITRCPVG